VTATVSHLHSSLRYKEPVAKIAKHTLAVAVLQDLHRQTDKVQHQAKEKALPLTLYRNLKANELIHMLQLLQQRQLQGPLVDLVEDLGPSLLT